MRNFSKTVDVTINTYDIAGGEYTCGVSEVYVSALKAFSRALEVERSTVSNLVGDYVTSGNTDNPIWMKVTASEADAITRLADFVLTLTRREAFDFKWSEKRTIVYIYTNLNTGVVFTWIDFIG